MSALRQVLYGEIMNFVFEKMYSISALLAEIERRL
jgi:hypothetical protein